jgi:hypothetical protein
VYDWPIQLTELPGVGPIDPLDGVAAGVEVGPMSRTAPRTTSPATRVKTFMKPSLGDVNREGAEKRRELSALFGRNASHDFLLDIRRASAGYCPYD